jgi:hypothetical protein
MIFFYLRNLFTFANIKLKIYVVIIKWVLKDEI